MTSENREEYESATGHAEREVEEPMGVWDLVDEAIWDLGDEDGDEPANYPAEVSVTIEVNTDV